MPPKKENGNKSNKGDNEKNEKKPKPKPKGKSAAGVEPTAEAVAVESPVDMAQPIKYVIPEEEPYQAEHHDMNFDKYPLYFAMPAIKDTSIFDAEPTVTFSANIDYPRFEYGFHHYIHQGKNYFGEVVNSLAGKKPVWRVLNKYEVKIDNFDGAIADVTQTYLNINKGEPEILSRAFYKLWEILMSFDLIDLAKERFTSAHLAEGPGSFIQATILYRDTFCKKGVAKNDKYHGVTLHPEGKSYVPEMDKKFVEFYNKEAPKRLHLHKTYSKQTAGKSESKDNGDITNPKTMRLFGGEIDGKCDLVTADGGFETDNENLQEQESFRLIISEIINAIRIQKKGGHFICKFFETFTNTSMKIVAILCELYDEVQFVKPLTSRLSNSEKYAVCMGFKYTEKDKEYKTMVDVLETLLDTMHKNKDQFVVGLFDDYIVPQEVIKSVINMNLLISNLQLKNINLIVDFIRKEIFSGDTYHDGRDDQIAANKYWVEMFYPPTNELEKGRTKCKQLIKDIYKVTKARLAGLNKLKTLQN